MSNPVEQKKIAAFQERVRARLAAMNTTGTELAKKMGMTHQAWSDLIGRGPYLQFRSLERIAEVLEVTVGWLTDGDPRDAFKSKEEMPEQHVETYVEETPDHF